MGKKEGYCEKESIAPQLEQPPSISSSRQSLARPGITKQATPSESTSILQTMAKKQQQQQLATPEGSGSVTDSRPNLLLNEDELSRASVEDFFYHHPKLRRSSAATSQLSSGTQTPLDFESLSSSPQQQQLYTLLLRSNLSNSSYIQPRAHTPPMMKSSLVVDVVKKEPQTPSLKVVPKAMSSANITLRNVQQLQLSVQTTKSGLYKSLNSKKFSSSEHIPINSYEAVYDDSGIEDDFDDASYYDVPAKVTPYGGSSHPDVNQFVSNRTKFFETAPFEVTKLKAGNISLFKAIDTAIKTDVISSDQLWIGSLGMPSDEVPQSTRTKIGTKLQSEYHLETIFIDDTTFQGHYKSFCKQILWPSLHYQIPDNPKSKVFEEHSWDHYQKVNEIFAKKIVAVHKDGDVIWVHDYHLLLVPQLVRKELPNAKIGLFLHVAFPSSEVFRCFAQREKLLQGMLGANVISFQTQEYVRHFVQTCNRLLLSDYTSEGINYDSRTIKINHIPIGIDAASLKEKLISSPEIKYWQKLIKQRWPNKKLIVTRDKLDKIRGIKQKLLAYEKFLTRNPEYLDEVIFVQICPQNAGLDEDLETTISTIVDRINSKSTNISISQPVVFLNQDIDFDQYLALLTEADTFIVSTMREGMNLTCHEFIVSTYSKHSPLILSEFTGSAAILNKGAILINPWDIKQVSLAIEEAITKSEDDKLKNWNQLNDLVYQHDSKNWVKNCVGSINSAWQEQISKTIPHTLTRDKFVTMYNNVAPNAKRIFILDMNSILSTVKYESSTLHPVEIPTINSLLTNLTADPSNAVYVMSYLKKDVLASLHKQIPNLGLIAENGGYVRIHDSNKWYSVSDQGLAWKPAVIEYVKTVVERLPLSTLEIEDCTIRVHTEKASADDEERKIKLVGEMIAHINDVFVSEMIHASCIDDVVNIQQIDLPKSLLLLICHSVEGKHLLDLDYDKVPSSPSSASFDSESLSTSGVLDANDSFGLLCIIGGGNATDETLFQYGIKLKSEGRVQELLTIEVGKVQKSLADQYVVGVNELSTILKTD